MIFPFSTAKCCPGREKKSVWGRAKNILDSSVKKGAWKLEVVLQCELYMKKVYNYKIPSAVSVVQEVEKLENLVAIHGHKFATIGKELGRSRMSVKDKWSDLYMGKSKSGGAWSSHEFDLLAELVRVIVDSYSASRSQLRSPDELM